MRRHLGRLVSITLMVQSACGGGRDPDAGDNGGDPDAGDPGGGSDAGADGVCAPGPDESSVTYYFAINDPAADNDDCDGLAPTDEGGGRCPFRDFESLRTRTLLVEAADVRVELRGGTYPVTGFGSENGLDGIPIVGAGRSADERVVLTSYQGEQAVLDGQFALREVVIVSGQHVAIEGITVRGGGGYNLEVRGAQHVSIRCNRFLDNMSSDSLKGDGGAGFVEVASNVFTGWDSQAIDMTEIHDWVIQDNEFYDPRAPDGGAVGTKFGARDVIVRRNLVHDVHVGFGSGTSAPHDDEFEAYDIVWEDNTLRNLTGVAVKLYSCSGCEFRGNDIDGAQAGVLFTTAGREGPSGCPGGCSPSHGAVITGNRMRGMAGPPADIQIATYTSEMAGLVAGDNLYCVSAPDQVGFGIDETPIDFASWKSTTGTDASSIVVSATDPACVGW